MMPGIKPAVDRRKKGRNPRPFFMRISDGPLGQMQISALNCEVTCQTARLTLRLIKRGGDMRLTAGIWLPIFGEKAMKCPT